MIYTVGEKLNSSVPSTGEAMLARDFDKLAALALAQAEAGASCLDINTALCGEAEVEMLCRLACDAAEKTECDIMLDSPSPDAIIAALPHTKDRYTIINSVTADERLEELIPAAVEYSAGVVGLPIRSGTIPHTPEGRLENALAIRARLNEAGIPDSRIYIDALAESVAMGGNEGKTLLETVRLLRRELPDIHIICGLSNVSFGLPKRAKLNAAAATLLIEAGADCFICDAASPSLKSAIAACEAFTGKDEYCMDYITYVRSENE
ncbi:MAG: dihydropteroate synthase [Clostridia bacterium]|nr:dihydropteroate synthase [Clostridia bacterium]